MFRQFLAFGFIILLGVGCNQNPATSTSNGTDEGQDQAPIEAAPVDQQASEPVITERVKAAVGVGKKGRSLDQYDKGIERVIAQPAQMKFAIEEKAVFEIKIPQAMQIFEALEGRAPSSHEEFMSKIIQANNIQLPTLPEGQKYIYDPDTKQLMVERPMQ